MSKQNRIQPLFQLDGKVALVTGASKAALVTLTQAMAQEWGVDNIRVNTICPGLIRTKFSEALWSDGKILDR